MGKGIQSIRRQSTGAALERALHQFGRRWTLRVIWELRLEARSFRSLQRACGGVSPSVLQVRLHELRRLGLIEQIPGLGYRLTAAGEQLFRTLAPLAAWAEEFLGQRSGYD